MNIIKYFLLLVTAVLIGSCNKYLDIVPDNVADLSYAFRLRTTAERYLASCYSYIPRFGNKYYDPGLFGSDELWLSNDKADRWPNWELALGKQNASSPIISFWNGGNGGSDLWEAVSQCNIFLENIGSVPDMQEYEKKEWKAEVKFLKAYYYFLLLRSYGPIPIMKENISVSASGENVRVFRQPIDSVFNYIVGLIDEAAEDLPIQLRNESSEYGRITLPIALGYKAKILTYAASPLFNGNHDYANFKNEEGVPFFNQEYTREKWEKAVQALTDAVYLAELQGYKLYEFQPSRETQGITDTLKTTLTLRGIITDRWNNEIIWANPNSVSNVASLQEWTQPKALTEDQKIYSTPNGSIGVTMNMVKLFYTHHGVPIDQDKTWDYNNRFKLEIAGPEDKYYIKEGQMTAKLNYDRGPRFYADLGFDRGVWYGQGNYDQENPYWLKLRIGEFGGKTQTGWHAVTGYYAKKLINYTNHNSSRSEYESINYPWPLLRLGDLYLLLAEALNELDGPGPEAYKYLDKIRARASLPGVLESWQKYSNEPNKPKTKKGLREIIHRERTIEMAFEGERFWDLRRWKTAPSILNQPITGWDVDQSTAEGFYRVQYLFNQKFQLKDYFWPIADHELIVNKNLVQNPGW